MDYKEFKELVRQVRRMQKKYFATRDKEVLDECKELEKRLDEELDNQQRLF